MDKNNWEELNQKMMKNGWSEQAVFEIQDYLNEAYQEGLGDKKMVIKETLEEVEKVIKEKASLKTEDKVVDIAILLFSEDILQQLHKMK